MDGINLLAVKDLIIMKEKELVEQKKELFPGIKELKSVSLKKL